jgi:N4-gp56 family major capsid protein
MTMADTFIVSASRKQVWDAKFIAEYVRASQFSDMMGSDTNKPIYIDRDLMREKGETKNVPLRAKLSGAGVTGNTSLEGNEESLNNYNDPVTIEWKRNAVLVDKREEHATELDIREGGKMALKDWFVEEDRDQIIQTLESPSADGLTAYADCSEAVKDAWLVANSDRVLFGATSGNYSGDHSADLAKLDTTADKLTYSNVRAARALMKVADPLIRPIKIDSKGEFYVAYCNSYAMRDLRISLDSIHQSGRERGLGNPLFQDGDIIFENIVFKEVPEMTSFADVGDSGTTDVAAVVYCGAQAVLGCYKQMPKLIVDAKRDYEFRYGVAIEGARRFKKAYFNSKQHGVFTQYVAADPS